MLWDESMRPSGVLFKGICAWYPALHTTLPWHIVRQEAQLRKRAREDARDVFSCYWISNRFIPLIRSNFVFSGLPLWRLSFQVWPILGLTRHNNGQRLKEMIDFHSLTDMIPVWRSDRRQWKDVRRDLLVSTHETQVRLWCKETTLNSPNDARWKQE